MACLFGCFCLWENQPPPPLCSHPCAINTCLHSGGSERHVRRLITAAIFSSVVAKEQNRFGVVHGRRLIRDYTSRPCSCVCTEKAWTRRDRRVHGILLYLHRCVPLICPRGPSRSGGIKSKIRAGSCIQSCRSERERERARGREVSAATVVRQRRPVRG